MKLTENILFAHPVLREDPSSNTAADYSSKSKFKIEFKGEVASSGNYKIESDVLLNNAEIEKLIADGDAKVGYYITCLDTFLIKLVLVTLGKKEEFFNLNELHGLVSLQPVIWVENDIASFTSGDLDTEFGGSTSFQKGDIIALGSEAQFTLDPLKFKPMGDIFSLEKSSEIDEGIFEVDMEDDIIIINAAEPTCDEINNIRTVPQGPEILLNSVYLPVLVQVISELKQETGTYSSNLWYRTIKAKCEDMAMDITQPNLSALFIAQKLLRHPLREAFSTLGSHTDG